MGIEPSGCRILAQLAEPIAAIAASDRWLILATAGQHPNTPATVCLYELDEAGNPSRLAWAIPATKPVTSVAIPDNTAQAAAIYSDTETLWIIPAEGATKYSIPLPGTLCSSNGHVFVAHPDHQTHELVLSAHSTETERVVLSTSATVTPLHFDTIAHKLAGIITEPGIDSREKSEIVWALGSATLDSEHVAHSDPRMGGAQIAFVVRGGHTATAAFISAAAPDWQIPGPGWGCGA